MFNPWPRPFFTAAEMLYSLKSFIAAMLALYISSKAGLPNTFWSMITVYVVSQPWAGMVRSKALYRVAGTFIGCSVALFLLPPLVQSPPLLSGTLALWVGFCVFISQLDRTPRSYVFMLAGYTAAFIAFPGVGKPQVIFETAITRVEEIFIGIMCATLVHSVILPNGLTGTVMGLVDKCFNNILKWMQDIYSLDSTAKGAQEKRSDRITLSADITQLRMLSTHIPFDTTNLKWTSMAIQEMQNSFAELLPLLSATEDRIQALQKYFPESTEDVVVMTKRLRLWLEEIKQNMTFAPHYTRNTKLVSAMLLQAMQSLKIVIKPGPDEAWQMALRISLLDYITRLDRQWRHCVELRDSILRGLQAGKMPENRRLPTRAYRLHRDKGVAVLSALTAFVAIGITCYLWIISGWSDGSTAAMMAAVFCSFFASMDNPVPHINTFIKYTAWSFPFAVIFTVGLLPIVNDFAMLVVVCAPFFLVTGCYTARPTTITQALPFLFGVAGTLLLHDYGTVTLPVVINTFTAQLLGTWIAAIANKLMRTLSSEWSVNRIRRSVRNELAMLTTSTRIHQNEFMVRAVDRTGLVAARLAQYDPVNREETTEQALRDLRTGENIVSLRQTEKYFPSVSVSLLLSALRAYFLSDISGRKTPPESLRLAVDSSLLELFQQPSGTVHWHICLSAIVGIRNNLFPDAGPELLTRGD